MGATITICHWTDGGMWEAITVNHNALEGHQNHFDIWPPVPDVTQGQNWPVGEDVYINGCALQAQPSPSPSPGPSLPESGAGVLALLLLATLLVAVGLCLIDRSGKQ
jgi:hypothetical protein